MDYIFIVQLVKDTVTSDKDEVIVVADLEGGDVGLCYDYLGVSFIFGHLGFDVAEGTRDRESTRKDSVGTQYHLLLTTLAWTCTRYDT